MNILLVNLYYGPRTQPLVSLVKRKIVNPHLGLLRMATMIRDNGHRAFVIDEQITDNMTLNSYAEFVRKEAIDIVGFSVNTLNYNYFVKLSEHIKNKTDSTVIAGGPHITALEEKSLHPYVDYLFLGEADFSLLDFLKALANGNKKQIKTMPGLLFSDNGKIINNGKTLVDDIDKLPFPDRNFCDPLLYQTVLPDGQRVRSTGISASRGCPFKCAFCAEKVLSNNIYRCHSPEYVFREMEYVQDTFGINHINFYDSTFNMKRKNVIELCQLIIDSGRKFTFWPGCRARLLDREQMEMMKKAGIVRIGFGVESANQRILELIRKEQTKEDYLNAFHIAQEFGVPAEGTAIIGHPGETFWTMFETAEFLRKSDNLVTSTLGIAIPYPGTELYDMAKEHRHGLKLLSEDWDKYHIYGSGVMEVNGYSPAQIVFLQKLFLTWSYLKWKKISSVFKVYGFKAISKAFLQLIFKSRN